MKPRHPEVTVELSGPDGNAHPVLGRCRRAAAAADLSDEEIAAFVAEAAANDYHHLLRTPMRWFEVV
jgi:hypothetical protein